MTRRLSLACVMLALMAAAGCSTPRKSVEASPHYKVGKPYQVAGRWYRPHVDENYDRRGLASWYGDQFHGRLTANGEIFDMNRLSAAHKTLPLPSIVEVQNLENGRKILVRVNDRGPFVDDRIIDLSRAAAKRLGFLNQGIAKVRVRFKGPAKLASAAPRAGSTRPPERREQPIKTPQPQTDGITQILQTLSEAELSDLQEQSLAAVSEPVNASEAPTTEAPPAVLAQAASEPNDAPLSEEAAPGGAPTPRLAPEPAMVPVTVSVMPDSGAADTGIIDMSKVDTEFLPSKKFTIAVAALSMLDNLQEVRTALSAIGPLKISRHEEADGEPVYKVTMGPFEDLQDAERRLEKVREAGYPDASLKLDAP